MAYFLFSFILFPTVYGEDAFIYFVLLIYYAIAYCKVVTDVCNSCKLCNTTNLPFIIAAYHKV